MPNSRGSNCVYNAIAKTQQQPIPYVFWYSFSLFKYAQKWVSDEHGKSDQWVLNELGHFFVYKLVFFFNVWHSNLFWSTSGKRWCTKQGRGCHPYLIYQISLFRSRKTSDARELNYAMFTLARKVHTCIRRKPLELSSKSYYHYRWDIKRGASEGLEPSTFALEERCSNPIELTGRWETFHQIQCLKGLGNRLKHCAIFLFYWTRKIYKSTPVHNSGKSKLQILFSCLPLTSRLTHSFRRSVYLNCLISNYIVWKKEINHGVAVCTETVQGINIVCIYSLLRSLLSFHHQIHVQSHYHSM